MLKKWIIAGVTALLLGVTLLLVFQPFGSKPQRAEVTEESSVLPEVKSIQVKKSDLAENIVSYGNVTFFRKVNVSSKVEEFVDKISVDIGDNVHNKQLLVNLNSQALQLALESAREEVRSKENSLQMAVTKYQSALQEVDRSLESLEKLQIDKKQKELELANQARVLSNKRALLEVEGIALEKYREVENSYESLKLEYEALLKQMAISQIGFRDSDIRTAGFAVPDDRKKRNELFRQINTRSELAEKGIAEVELEKSKIQLRSIELNLKDCTIYSTMNGVVASRYIEPGEKATTSDPLLTLMDIEKVYIDLPVPETDLARVRLGQSVQIKIDAYNGRAFNGTVEKLFPMVDTKTRTANVRCLIRNQRGERSRYLLLPGMFVRAKIVSGVRKNVIIIPVDSMAGKEDNRIKVFLLRKSNDGSWIALEKWIPYVKIGEDGIEISEGLNEGDRLAFSGLDFLETGSRVRTSDE